MLFLTDAIRLNGGIASMYNKFTNGECNEDELKRLTRVFKRMFFNVFYPGEKQSSRRIELRSFDKSTANTNLIQDLNQTVAKYFREKVCYQQCRI
jgi:hypothetical protein